MRNSAFSSTAKFIVTTFVVASFSLLTWVVPNLFLESGYKKDTKAKPLTALQLAGRDVYISEGCHLCHTLMVRPVQAEILRYGPTNTAQDDVYEHPFLWGSKRAGPDLTNVGGKFSNEWQELHLKNPRDVVPISIMPAFPWLFEKQLDPESIAPRMRALKILGVPYTEKQIGRARLKVKGRTQGDALISYLQQLGVKSKPPENAKAEE